MAKDVAEEKAYEHLTAHQRAIQRALGVELKLHPVRADLVEADNLIEIDEDLEEYGFPVQQGSPNRLKKAMENVFPESDKAPTNPEAKAVKTPDGAAEPHGRGKGAGEAAEKDSKQLEAKRADVKAAEAKASAAKK